MKIGDEVYLHWTDGGNKGMAKRYQGGFVGPCGQRYRTRKLAKELERRHENAKTNLAGSSAFTVVFGTDQDVHINPNYLCILEQLLGEGTVVVDEA